MVSTFQLLCHSIQAHQANIPSVSRPSDPLQVSLPNLALLSSQASPKEHHGQSVEFLQKPYFSFSPTPQLSFPDKSQGPSYTVYDCLVVRGGRTGLSSDFHISPSRYAAVTPFLTCFKPRLQDCGSYTSLSGEVTSLPDAGGIPSPLQFPSTAIPGQTGFVCGAKGSHLGPGYSAKPLRATCCWSRPQSTTIGQFSEPALPLGSQPVPTPRLPAPAKEARVEAFGTRGSCELKALPGRGLRPLGPRRGWFRRPT